jgi:hypothetical protein
MRSRAVSNALPATPNPALWADDMDAELELLGFWRMFGGGGRCILRWDGTDGAWHGTVENAPRSPSRHVAEPCRFSPYRLDDFLRMADCRQVGPHRWLLRYREPR